jgi:hypothetical protein
MTTGVTGTLAVANGGTGRSTLTAGAIILGNGTTAVGQLSGTSLGQVPQWDGSTWGVSTLPPSGVASVSATSPIASSGGATPNISLTGTVAVANGGTGVATAPANGQLLIGNGSGYAQATLTAGTGITVTNGSGAVTVSAINNGTVTSVVAGTGLTGGTITGSGTIALDNISAGSTVTGAVRYNGTTRTAGQLYGGTTNPTSTTRLNYDGHLYATRFFGDGSGLVNLAATGVTTFSAGTTGLTPSTANNGAITLGGTLAVANGGTGATTAATARTSLGVTATGSDTTYAFRSNNLSDLSNATTARTNLGLGTVATQAANNVAITGGSIAGITDLAIADGGTGASTAAGARTNLELSSTNSVTFSTVADSSGNVRDIPQNAKTSAYTLIASDTGKHISITTGGVTIPSGVFSAGNIISIYNNSASSQTITQGSGVTLRLAGTATTGSRTLGQYGIATVICVASNVFVITGSGVI